jgi:hypothetical protein
MNLQLVFPLPLVGLLVLRFLLLHFFAFIVAVARLKNAVVGQEALLVEFVDETLRPVD